MDIGVTRDEPVDAVSGDAASTDDEERAARSLVALFRERRLSMRTMDRPLRVVTGIAATCLVGVVVLVALQNLAWPAVVLDASNDVVLQMPAVLFVATLVLLAVGFAYMLTGAVVASRPVAVLSLLLITGVLGAQFGAFGGLSLTSGLAGWARWVSVALMAAIWAVAGVVWWLDTRIAKNSQPRRLRLTVLAVYSVMFGMYFIALRVGNPPVGNLDIFPPAIAVLMAELILVVNPMLQIAAVDFGEWGGLLGARIAGAVSAERTRALALLGAALAGSLVVYGYIDLDFGDALLSTNRLRSALLSTAVVAAAAVLIIGIGRALQAHRRAWPETLNFAVLFAVTALSVYAILPLSTLAAGAARSPAEHEQVSSQGAYTAYADVVSVHSGSGEKQFTMLIPRSWQHRDTAGIDSWLGLVESSSSGTAGHGSELVYVMVQPLAHDAAAAAAADGETLISQEMTEGPWTRVEVADSSGRELVWARPVPNSDTPATFVLRQIVTGIPLGQAQPLFKAIAASFRTAAEAPAALPEAQNSSEAVTEAHTDAVAAIGTGISAGLLVVLLIAVGVLRRRLHPLLASTVFLFGMTNLVTLVYSSHRIARVILGPATDWPEIGYHGVQFGIGVLALLAIVATAHAREALRRNVVMGLVVLIATIWTLRGVYVLFGYAISAGRVAAWAAIILLIAIAWDVAMSGEAMTNHGSTHFPRPTRVLMFFGYSIISGAAILFFAAQRTVSTGQPAEPFFEPDAVTRSALFNIALSVAVLLFFMRMVRERAEAPLSAEYGDQEKVARSAGVLPL